MTRVECFCSAGDNIELFYCRLIRQSAFGLPLYANRRLLYCCTVHTTRRDGVKNKKNTTELIRPRFSVVGVKI